jgi:hypothetical protein
VRAPSITGRIEEACFLSTFLMRWSERTGFVEIELKMEIGIEM